MNWGKGVALALIAFAAMMAWFLVKAAQNPTPLVTENYYEQELKFQGRIDEVERANALGAPVKVDLDINGLRLEFPQELHGAVITGKMTLLRPNDPDADRVLDVVVDSSGIFTVGLGNLVPGRYNALLEWSCNGAAYYTEEKLYVQ